MITIQSYPMNSIFSLQYFEFEKKSDHNKWDWHVIITGAEFKTFDSYRDDVKQLTISSPNKINSFSINMISLWSQCLRLEKKQSVFFLGQVMTQDCIYLESFVFHSQTNKQFTVRNDGMIVENGQPFDQNHHSNWLNQTKTIFTFH